MWKLVLCGGSRDFTMVDKKYSGCRSNKNGKNRNEECKKERESGEDVGIVGISEWFQDDLASCEMIGDDFRMISMWSEMMFDELGGSPMISLCLWRKSLFGRDSYEEPMILDDIGCLG